MIVSTRSLEARLPEVMRRPVRWLGGWKWVVADRVFTHEGERLEVGRARRPFEYVTDALVHDGPFETFTIPDYEATGWVTVDWKYDRAVSVDVDTPRVEL